MKTTTKRIDITAYVDIEYDEDNDYVNASVSKVIVRKSDTKYRSEQGIEVEEVTGTYCDGQFFPLIEIQCGYGSQEFLQLSLETSSGINPKQGPEPEVTNE